MEGLAVAAGATEPQQEEGSKAELAYRYLLERIESGEFAPGHRLVLGQIAKELGCSVVPVREAIRGLEAQNYVTYERNVGAQVALLDADLYHHTVETLAVVEGVGTALAQPHVDAELLAEARAINAQMRQALEHFDPTTFTQLNQRFHEVLTRRCPNPHLLDLIERGWRRLTAMRESTFGFVPGRAHQSVTEHDELLRLLETDASPTEIEQFARRHRMNSLFAVEKFPRVRPTTSTTTHPTTTPITIGDGR